MPHLPATPHDPYAEYVRLREAHRQEQASLVKRRSRLLRVLAANLVGFLLLPFLPRATAAHGILLALLYGGTAALFIVLIVRFLALQATIETEDRLLALYDAALGRTDGSQTQSGRIGPKAAADHLYARDLDLLGPNSLFGLLATVRTTVGEEGLLHYLLEPTLHEQACLRQQAIRELAPQTALREQIALLGASNVQRISATLIDDWLLEPAPAFHPAFRPALFMTAVFILILLSSGFSHPQRWSAIAPNLAAVIAIQTSICFLLRRRVAPLLATSVRLQQSVRLFTEGLELLDSLSFSSEKLRALQRQARVPHGAVHEMRRLQNLLSIVEQRGYPYFLPLSLLLAAGVQTAISLARWKGQRAPAMRLWLSAWSEFEALNAIATYAFEHPPGDGANCWPQLLPPDAPPYFEAKALAHPLLAGAVANDISLGHLPSSSAHFYLISGSNMAGKSTLLRSIGINAVLAYAGAPVRAQSLALTPLVLGASLALTDSLAEGKSKFLAEVERLAAIVDASKAAPVLFLVDEIFSGTNSADRATAAAAVLNKLLEHAAIGALSTHDLVLTRLATVENKGINMHMASPDASDPLAFDYRLKPGINTSSNALAIIRMLGLAPSTPATLSEP